LHATVIDYIAAQVNFPEIDLRQRLTVSSGYGVAEIHIPEGSKYIGKAISESGLREKDIVVLTLYRDAKVIPNPRPQRQLLAGDRLLCFGKLELMRDMTPGKVRRKRRPVIKDLPELPVAEEVYKDSGTTEPITIPAAEDASVHE
jgi:ribosomal protein S6--L-glutamate ligase